MAKRTDNSTDSPAPIDDNGTGSGTNPIKNNRTKMVLITIGFIVGIIVLTILLS
jgi:hypothetical protein